MLHFRADLVILTHPATPGKQQQHSIQPIHVMKKLITLLALFCLAAPVCAKDEDAPKKDRKEKKEDEKKDKKKEPVLNRYQVTLENVPEAKKDDVISLLKYIEGAKLEGEAVKAEKGENAWTVVVTSSKKLSRGDITKALRKEKEVKLASFRQLRDDDKKEEKDAEKKDDRKDAPKEEKKDGETTPKEK